MFIHGPDTKTKCRHIKDFTCEGALRQVFYLSEAPSTPMTRTLPHSTLYTCMQ
jgi:hypothetical protein